HTHIENFGGEKDNITIAGESAGSVIVSLLSMTEYAKGYYKRLIMQSGSAMWKLMDNELSVFQRSIAVAERLGCVNDSFKLEDQPNEAVECMRGKDALTIIKEEANLNPGSSSSFLPRYGDELFPKNPREVLLEGGFEFQELFIGNSGTEGAFK
ncbi:Acetylcholinesterase-1, partial [Araneus ventricosus]